MEGKEITGVDKSGNAITRKPSENEAFSALVFKTMADPFVGKLTLLRTYSGTLKSDSSTYNVNKDRVERIGQLFLVKGKTRNPLLKYLPEILEQSPNFRRLPLETPSRTRTTLSVSKELFSRLRSFLWRLSQKPKVMKRRSEAV